ncbi:MAG: acylneuraminate cytidylyltransferase family protein [Acidimicrobiales bacterium]
MLGLVCARGGSKGVPKKNLAVVAGAPLVAHTVLAHRVWGRADRVVCSTDDEEIADAARAAGAEVPWLRPPELAGDDVPKLAVIRHALEACEADDGHEYPIVVDLDVSSPLRTVDDIEATVRVMLERGATNAFTVTPAHRNPYFNMVELTDEGFAALSKRLDSPVSSRQIAPQVYDMNASVYAYTREFVMTAAAVVGPRSVVHVMPPERSIDVDGPVDLVVLRALIDEGLASFAQKDPR